MEDHGDVQTLGHLPETGDDLVDDKQIRASPVGPGIVEHQSPFSDSYRDIWNDVQVERWRYLHPLGRGGFGEVHLEEKIFERFPQSRDSRPQLRAVKVIPERGGGSNTMHHLPEILGMAKFSRYGASFVELYTWFQIGSNICIAMEWAPHGDLEKCVLQPLHELEAQEIMRQISLAVVIMHERRFLHRDLKPKNVFVFRKRPESPEWRVKLGDFGVSKRVRLAANTSWHTSIEADCSAPEVLGLLGGDYTEESSYAHPVDMWSLGYLAHWLLTKRYPVSKFALPRYCRQMDAIPLSDLAEEGVSNLAMDFVENLLHLAPADRMTAEEAYRHPWLALPCRKRTPSPERCNIMNPLEKSWEGITNSTNEVKGPIRTGGFAQGSSTIESFDRMLSGVNPLSDEIKGHSRMQGFAQEPSTTESLYQILRGLPPRSDDDDSEYVKIGKRTVHLDQ